jgi:hypothetical protein
MLFGCREKKNITERHFLPFDFGIERSRKGFAVAGNFKEERKTLRNGQKTVPHFPLSLSFFIFIFIFIFTGLLFSLIFR